MIRAGFSFFLLLSAIFFHGCGCAGKGRAPVRIGVDANWYPNDFGAQSSYVNGFVEELLLDVAMQTGLEFERISANGDALFEGMKAGRYQAVLSSLSPYEFNRALYDFSHNFLDLGPVLILPEGARHTDLDDMEGAHIGVLTGDPAILLLQKHEGLIVRSYPSAAGLLEAVVNGEIEAALLDRLTAGAYVSDLFGGKLKIAGPPLTDAGLRLVALKGKSPLLIGQFNKSLMTLKKKKRLQSLLRKWNLGEI